MGLMDKVTGRLKKAAGDLKGDEALRRQGADEERKAEAEEELEAAHEQVSEQAVPGRRARGRRGAPLPRLTAPA